MEKIAIIGVGCRFPCAENPTLFWQLLSNKIDAISDLPSREFDWDILNQHPVVPRTKTSSLWGGFLENVEFFDPSFFQISPKEAQRMDPQQRLLLEVAWESLENAGIAPLSELSGSKTGVFLGISSYDYHILLSKKAKINAYNGVGNALSIIANRLSYLLNLRGPSLVIDTACSGSLVALHYACQSLLSGESDLCLAGGVNLILIPEPTISFSHAQMMASDGRCKTFDAAADGYVRGEGCGVVVLKRLSDALRDGDNIQAIIRGSAVNQDGLSNGLTAPNGPAQQAVIRQALANAGVKPSQISYVETHGTGTSLGDPIEVNSLKAVLMEGREANQPCWIGSVKTNIGHLEAAAGIAGLIKVVLSLQHREIPPHLHFKQLNPYIKIQNTPILIPTELQQWPAQGQPRLAGLSAFGFGGTNAHVILEEAPPQIKSQNLRGRSCHLLTLSAKTESALQALVSRYQSHHEAHPKLELADICYTANTGREHFQHRLAVVVESKQQLIEQLAAFATGQETTTLSNKANKKLSKLAFLFTGQGSQYINMGRELYDTQPIFRQTIEQCHEILRPYLEHSLLEILYPDQSREEIASSLINQTAYTQPALFAFEYALYQLWKSWGIEPNVVMGHSVGEYVAACVAGVFSLEDGLKLIAHRGRLMQQLPSGGEMVSVMASEERVREAISTYHQTVALAAINGPESVVISGVSADMAAICDQLAGEGVKTKRLQVSHAFHSPLMAPILAEFSAIANQVTYNQPRIPLVSNVTAKLTEENITTGQYWVNHVLQTVRFANSIETLVDLGYEVFLEIGPKPILLGMGRECLPKSEGLWLPSLRPGFDEWQVMLSSLGQLHVTGFKVDFSGFDREYGRQKVILPTYPFQRAHYWFDSEQNQPPEKQPEASRLWEAVVTASSYQAQFGPFDLQLHIYPAKLEYYNSLTTAYTINALQKLGIYSQVGERHSVETLLSQFNILPTYRKVLSRWLEKLAAQSILQEKGQGFVNQKSLPKTSVDASLRQLRDQSPNAPQLVDLIQHCGENLAEVLVGKVHPLELIFPGGSSEITNYLYQQSPEARYFNGIARSVLEAVVKTQTPTKSLRILEVGAGTGGTTGSLLPILPKERTSYWFTDVSELFLEKAKQKFKNYPFVRYSLLDIEQNPQNQGYQLHSFDVVVAVNVLHATRNIEETLANVRSLLTPGGILLIVEVTNPQSWLDISFGLLEGWHKFEDNIRGNNPLLSSGQWESVLREDCEFERVLVLPNADSPTEILGQNILVAQSRLFTNDSTKFFNLTQTPHSICASAPLGEINEQHLGESRISDRPVAIDTDNLQQNWESQLHQKIANILGISTSEPNLDISLTNLGFDSLMAVELTNWIGKELGVNISVVSFPAGANITQLTNQVREAMDCAIAQSPTQYQEYPCLIPLQTQGSQPPFFSVHPIAGVVFPYYELTSILGKEQPFYGLQSFGLAGEGKPLTRIEDMAAHYIQAIRAVQPQGPYFLGGWSFGAYVAYEMAQQLQQDGQEVALLAVIDTPLHSQDKTANLFMLYKIFMVVSLRYIWPYVYDYFCLVSARNRPKKASEKRMENLDKLSYMMNSTTKAEILRQESKFIKMQQPILRHLLPVILANSKALINYVPQVYAGKITLFKTSQPLVDRQDKYGGWKDVSLNGVEIVQIPGHHLNCLRLPHVKVVAEKLAACIQKIKFGDKARV